LLTTTRSAVHVARFQLMTLVGAHRSERIAEGIRRTAHSRVALPAATHDRRRAHAQHEPRPAAAHIREATSAFRLVEHVMHAIRSLCRSFWDKAVHCKARPAGSAFRVGWQPTAAKARGYVTRSCQELVIVCFRLQMSGCVTRLGRTIRQV
jgi:hypothetical protein